MRLFIASFVVSVLIVSGMNYGKAAESYDAYRVRAVKNGPVVKFQAEGKWWVCTYEFFYPQHQFQVVQIPYGPSTQCPQTYPHPSGWSGNLVSTTVI